MDLKECIEFGAKNSNKISTNTVNGVITGIFPGPIDNDAFQIYIEIYIRTGDVIKSCVLSGATEYEPYLIFMSPRNEFRYSRYYTDFPDEQT
jgi:hypothetical protein